MSHLTESFRIAVESLLLNKVRAALTMLGIIIGVGAVIGLISLGRGVETYVKDQFNSLGANLLIITNQQPTDETRVRIDPLTTDDLDVLNDPSQMPNVGQAGAQYNVLGFVLAEGEGVRTTIRGVTANLSDIQNWDIETGQFINEQHVDDSARVAVLGIDLLEELWDDPEYDPVGEVLRINEQPYTVIGVMERRNTGAGGDNVAVMVPISTAQTRLADARVRGGHQITVIYAQARTEEVAFEAEADIDAYFRAEHDVDTDGEKDYEINNQAELLESAGQVTALLTVFLSMIAGVSLLVGGIGIMNIMLVTVTERTREIGLRKALGARPLDILLQFLFESVLLSLMGGAIGIFLGWLMAFTGTNAVEQLSLSVDPDAVLLATAVSTFVGVVFGLFPAGRAALMKPIDALRFE